MYNHELYKEAIKAQKTVDKTVNHMKKFSSKGVRAKLGKAGHDYLEQIDGILDRFDFRRNVSLKAVDKRKTLLEWYIEQRNEGRDVHIPEHILQEANTTHYKDMSLEQLESVLDTVKSIEHLARTKNKLLQEKRKRTLQQIADEIKSSGIVL